MKMKIFIPIMMLLFCMGLVAAATVVNLDPAGNLANATYQTSSTITYGINVTGNQTTYDCDLYTTENGSTQSQTWTKVVNNYPVPNATNTNFIARVDVADGTGATNYTWGVFCSGLTDPAGDWSINATFGVDTTEPVVTINFPTANKVWYTTGSDVRVGLTVTDTNADTCVFGSNLNQSSNNTGTYDTTFNSTPYTTATAFNISQLSASYNWEDNNTGAYLWTYTCNDSAGNEATLGSNYTFYVDSTSPAAFGFKTADFKTNNVALWNYTTATDYTPQIGYAYSVELNFSRYEIEFFISGNSTTVKLNDTTQGSSAANRTINITTLLADQTYQINITAYDLAGNSQTLTEQAGYYYSTDSTNRALKAGWNLVGNVGNAFNLSQILTWSGATTASIWNSTHEFQSHVSGGSYGASSVSAGEVVLLYLGADTNFGDLVWNTSVVGTTVDLLNATDSEDNSDWNLVMQKNSTVDIDLQSIDNYANCDSVGTGCASGANNATNVDYMSAYNNSASSGAKYISYVANWSINNATSLTYGETVWMYVDQNITLDWSVI